MSLTVDSRGILITAVVGIMLIILGILGSFFGLEVEMAIITILVGYGLFLLGITYVGLKDGGGSCCLSSFFAIFPLMPILMMAPYPLGMDKTPGSPTFMQFSSLGVGFLFFMIFYVFLGIIISIARGGSSKEKTKSYRASASYQKPVIHDPFKTGDERIVEGDMIIEDGRQMVRRIPSQCFKCGEDIDSEEVDWIGPDTVRCPHCGASLVVQFE